MESGPSCFGCFVQDQTAVVSDNLPGKAQTESQSTSSRTTGIERIEQMPPDLRSDDPGAIIDHRQLDGIWQDRHEVSRKHCRRDLLLAVIRYRCGPTVL